MVDAEESVLSISAIRARCTGAGSAGRPHPIDADVDGRWQGREGLPDSPSLCALHACDVDVRDLQLIRHRLARTRMPGIGHLLWRVLQCGRGVASSAAIKQRTPSGANSSRDCPSRFWASACSIRWLPNPLRDGGMTCGPPLSLQLNSSQLSSTFQRTSTRPSGRESAPYFAALVASSCNASERVSAWLGEMSIERNLTRREWRQCVRNQIGQIGA
jgi:hypothetical protein